MNGQINIYAFSLIVASLVPGATAIYAWHRRTAMGAKMFALLMLTLTVWTLAYGIELACTTLDMMLFWIKVEYLGISTMPAIWFIFAIQYAHYESWLTGRNIILLFIVPAITLILNWTNEFHYWYYSYTGVDATGPFPLLDINPGPWYLVHFVYFYLMILGGVILIWQVFNRSARLYRSQTGLILIGALVPWVVNVFYLMGLRPFAHIDLTPFAFIITGVAISSGMFRFQLLDVVPVARSKVVESMSDAMVVLDNQDRVIDLNPAAYQFINKEIPAPIGQPAETVLAPWPKLMAHSSDISETRLELILEQGSTRHFDLQITPVHDGQGRLTGRLLVWHDITTRKQTEVVLQQAKEAAEAANYAKSAFLTTMSHELRTPLNAIIGFAQLMNHSASLPPEHRDYTAIITRSGEHLLNLVNDILDMSKIEAGQIMLNPKLFDLYHLLAQIEDIFRLRASGKGLYLLVEIMPDVPRNVQTDEGKLRQVLINLVGNAIKFTERGGIMLRVELKGQAITPNSTFWLHFSITDTGPGIAPTEIKTIFEPFGQTELGRYTEQGAGLGLTISRKFVQLMGGEITVASEIGQGSTFSFSIQVDRIEPNTLVRSEPELTRRVIGLEPGQPHYRVLIVDDNLENRQLLVELLAPIGFDLREATNGQEAVEVWTEWQPHLIWMDVRMPVMDGYMATRQIKSAPQGRQTVIIAITASAFEEEQAVALASGCTDFIRKPFREAEIFELMREYLGLSYIEAVWQADTTLAELKEEDKAAIDWSVLPAEVLSALEQAALRIDVEEVANLIETVRGYNSSLAGILAELAHRFQYDEIVALLERRLR